MTLRRKLLLGVSLLVAPALVVGVVAIRGNALERRALESLGTRLARSRTYAELETAMFSQSEVLWRYLSGYDPGARREFELTGEVVDYWFARWEDELAPADRPVAEPVRQVQVAFRAVGDSIFRLMESGRREAAYRLAVVELQQKLEPALTTINRDVYRRTRESSVRGAFTRVEEIVNTERRLLAGVVVAATLAGLVAAWALGRSLVRPLNDLRGAMAVVGSGNLAHPVTPAAEDEIGDLARAFAGMIDQLRVSRAQLVQSEKLASIGEMSAAVAHGLRNPLASLRASAQLVLRHPGSPAAAEHLAAILDEVDRLDRRISHLLAFARPSPSHPVPARVPDLVREILPAFRDRLDLQRVTIRVEVPETLPDILVDPIQTEQALLELVANALDAMPSGGTLTVRAAAEPGPPAGVVVEIADTGAGIPAAAMASVGTPFFSTRPEGTGLGLATARRFVEQHGGRLELASEPGAGTTARARWPLSGALTSTPTTPG